MSFLWYSIEHEEDARRRWRGGGRRGTRPRQDGVSASAGRDDMVLGGMAAAAVTEAVVAVWWYC